MVFDLFGNIFGAGGGALRIIGYLFWGGVIGVPTIGIIGGFFYWVHKKKKWNLDVEFKLPRSDGRLVNAEWGRGCFDSKKGVVFLKRKKKRAIAMKPFEIGRFLQGDRILSVIQVGPTDYIPILNNSWIEMQSDKPLRDKEGNIKRNEYGKPIFPKAALMRMKVDNSKSTSWKNSFEREAKSAYSIIGLLEKYAPFIGVALILVFNFVGFAILWTKVA